MPLSLRRNEIWAVLSPTNSLELDISIPQKNDDELLETFQHFDKDKNGSLEYEEFLALLDALGFDADPDIRKLGFEIVDGNNNGLITFAEFSAWYRSR